MKPVLIDLFCGAGGATKGYQLAGFHVIGIDIKPQPNYCGDYFIQDDALEVLKSVPNITRLVSSAIHASPPCQFGTAYKRRPNHVFNSPNLIPQTRALLETIGVPYVIENTWLNHKHLIDPVKYCGSSFGLDVQRHRAFESNIELTTPECDHSWQTPRFPPASNRTNLRKTVEIGVWRIPLSVQRKAIGIDWMNREELSQAIPPAYTEHIGRQFMNYLSFNHQF